MKKVKLLFLLAAISFIITCCSDNGNNPANTCNTTIDPKLQYIYDCPPDTNTCYEGRLANSEKMKVLDRVNYFRNLHGLPVVTYNYTNDIYVQKAALICSINQTLSHTPDNSFKCYSPQGDTGCGESNLHLSYSSQIMTWNSESSIDSWINEKNSIGGSIGHRRWLLNPFLKSIAFGRVDKVTNLGSHFAGASIHIFDMPDPANTTVPFVACPYHDYPKTAFGIENPSLYLSFSVLSNNQSFWGNNNVNFSSATIEITDPSQNLLNCNTKTFDNQGAGIPNNLQWRVNGLQYNIKYNVKISNVKIGSQVQAPYEYWFKIVN